MNGDTVEVENPTLGKLKLTGQTALLLLALVAAGAASFGVYLLLEHKAEARDRDSALVRAIDKMSASQDEQAKATRETGCIVAYRGTSSSPRETLDFCKQVTR